MSIEIIPVNGKNINIDYEAFEETANEIIGETCTCAKIFLLNDFPFPISGETNCDLIIVIAIENKLQNYYSPKYENDRRIYFHNQIIPILFVNQFEDCDLSKDDKGHLITNNDEYLDYSNEVNSMKFGFRNYLSNRCGFENEKLFIEPLIWVQNKSELFHDEYFSSPKIDFKVLANYFKEKNSSIFISYNYWKTEIGYKEINDDIKRIVEQASLDSEVGYLTKKKINRIVRQLSNTKKIFSELNENLVMINGKAGTGKSSELLLLNMHCIDKGQNSLFLTYNKLLIFDIAKTIKSYRNSKLNSRFSNKPGEASVTTLHSFFYRLSKSLGVLHVLSEKRLNKLLIKLKQRMRLIYNFVFVKIQNGQGYEEIKTAIQNKSDFDAGTKEVGIDFINFLFSKAFNRNTDLKQ